jgi:hypothetical protein
LGEERPSGGRQSLTSFALEHPTPTLPSPLPQTTTARNDISLPPFFTVVTRRTCSTQSISHQVHPSKDPVKMLPVCTPSVLCCSTRRLEDRAWLVREVSALRTSTCKPHSVQSRSSERHPRGRAVLSWLVIRPRSTGGPSSRAGHPPKPQPIARRPWVVWEMNPREASRFKNRIACAHPAASGLRRLRQGRIRDCGLGRMGRSWEGAT